MAAIWRTAICVVCGKEFLTDQPQRKYCSRECNRIATNRLNKIRKAKYRAEKKRQFEEAMLRANGKDVCRGCCWKTPGQKICVMPVCLHGLERTWEWERNKKS